MNNRNVWRIEPNQRNKANTKNKNSQKLSWNSKDLKLYITEPTTHWWYQPGMNNTYYILVKLLVYKKQEKLFDTYGGEKPR